MPTSENTQQKLGRIRRPRVHLTYDVEVGGAMQIKELPFVVGVLADLSGKPDQDLPKLKDRSFVDIDGDNFDKVLAAMRPRLDFTVENKLQGDGSRMRVELRFAGMDDFGPENVARQVEPLRRLLDARQRLADLVSKVDGNDKLDALLLEVISNTEALKKLASETGQGEPKTEEVAR